MPDEVNAPNSRGIGLEYPAGTAASTEPSPRRRGRMLVVRGGALGDFILTLPVLSALRQAFPDTHIEVLANPRYAELAVIAGHADGARALESRGLAGFFARRGDLDRSWSEYFAGFNVILSYLYDPDLFFQTNISRVSKAQILVGPHRPDETKGEPAARQLLRPVEKLAIFDADSSPSLAPNRFRGDGPGGISASPSRLVLHPGSGSERKNWPEHHWRTLLEKWGAEGGWEIELVGGEAEGDRLARLALGLPTVRVVFNEALPLLAARIAGARLFVGHDSGISHLAAATGVRGLVLWGPSHEPTWRPHSNRFVSLRHADGLEGLTTEVVDARVREGMA